MSVNQKRSVAAKVVKFIIRKTPGNGALGNKIMAVLFLLVGLVRIFWSVFPETYEEGILTMLYFMMAFLLFLKAGFIELYYSKNK